GTSMNDHITVFNQLVADLFNLDVTFSDEDLALMLLSSLPDEFEHLETTLLHGKDDVSLAVVCAVLYSYELRKKNKKENRHIAVEDEALVARGRSQSQKKGRSWRSRSKSRPAKDECVFCHEKVTHEKTDSTPQQVEHTPKQVEVEGMAKFPAKCDNPVTEDLSDEEEEV
ncbi:hypothetical protein Pfo_016258, partial [Paulownia fortunei]